MRYFRFFIFTLLLFTVLCPPEVFAQCYPDRHNTSKSSSWISCTQRVSPNADRSSGHWIKYDLGDQYTISSITLWNINHPDHLNDGARTIALEHRIADGEWLDAGTLEIQKGDGSAFYEGQYIELKEEITADEILLTLLDNHGGSCYGFAEVRFDLKGMTTATENIEDDPFNILITPNPFTDFAAIEITDLQGSFMDYRVINGLGQVMLSDRESVHSGQSNFVLNTSGFPSGNYFLKVIDGRKVSIEKLSHQIK